MICEGMKISPTVGVFLSCYTTWPSKGVGIPEWQCLKDSLLGLDLTTTKIGRIYYAE